MIENNLYNNHLYRVCCVDDTSQVLLLLKTFQTIDILYEEGSCVKLSISRNNPEICDALLSFFYNQQNPTDKQKEYLKQVISDETDQFTDISDELRPILEKYHFLEDNSSQHYFSEEEEEGEVIYFTDESSTINTDNMNLPIESNFSFPTESNVKMLGEPASVEVPAF